ncbi:hypothetical protein SRHO_G00076030 [Serrasalmus rhombeus]
MWKTQRLAEPHVWIKGNSFRFITQSPPVGMETGDVTAVASNRVPMGTHPKTPALSQECGALQTLQTRPTHQLVLLQAPKLTQRPTSSDQLTMKWTAGVRFGPGGLVLVLAVILGMSTLGMYVQAEWPPCPSGQASSSGSGPGPASSQDCSAQFECKTIVLIDGSYTKQIQMPNTTNSCLNYSANSPPRSDEICVFSFNTSENNNVTYAKTGVWLLKTNDSYQLKITREKTRPTVPICFGRGQCNSSWPEWIKNWTTKPNKMVSSNEACTIVCLNPKSACDDAVYKQCNDTTSNEDIIEFTNQSSTCSKCGSPVQKPQVQLTLPKVELSGGKADKTDKSEVMKNLTSSVLEMMGNKTTASVTMGDVQGVFLKPEDQKKLQPASFIYSDVTNLSIIQDTTQTQKYPRIVSVPKEALEKAATQSQTALFTAVFRFPEFPKSGVTLHCHSWDGEGAKPNWTTTGCFTIETDDGVTCACVHLTFFALLMAANPTDTISSTDLSNLTYITSIGCGLSIFFLGVALFMHFLLRRARQSDSVHILINLFVSLVLLNLTFLTNEYVANTGNLIGCKLMAGFMHYCLLTSFTWFGLEALHLCLQLGRSATSIKHYLTKICIAGWAPSAVVVTVVFCLQKYNQLVIHADDGKDVKMCWITDSAVHYVVNIGYYSVIFVFTFTTFVIMLRWIVLLKGTAANRREPLASSGKRTTTGTSDALTVMGLCSTLGLTWGFAFFAYGALRIPSYYIFTILNSFQGFFLFIYYYKTSRFVGDQMTSEKTSATTEATSMENPYSRIYSSLRRPTSSDQLCEEKLGELKMKWTAGVKSGPYRSVVVLAVILGMSSLSLSKSCKIDKTCTSIVVIDGNYTGMMKVPNKTSTCPNNSDSSVNDTVCFFSFDTVAETSNISTAQMTTTVSTSYTTSTKPQRDERGKRKPSEKISKLSKRSQEYLQKHPNILRQLAGLTDDGGYPGHLFPHASPP